MKIVEDYLEEVCSYITIIPFRRMIRRELRTHIEDCMAGGVIKNMNEEEAAVYAISQIGDAKKTGELFNDQYTVQPNYKIIIYVVSLFLFHIIMQRQFSSFWEDASFLLLSAVGAVAIFFTLCKIDAEKYFYIIKLIYFVTVIVWLIVCIWAEMSVKKECALIASTVLDMCLVFFTYRLKEFKLLGFGLIFGTFLIPTPLFFLSTAYAALFIYFLVGTFIIVNAIIKSRWEWNFDGKFLLVLIVLSLSCLFILGTANIIERKFFTKYFILQGLNDHFYLAENFDTYPLATYRYYYGDECLIVYCILLFLVLNELIIMRNKIHNFLGKNIVTCVFLVIFVKSVFSILLNLGYPFICSYMLPFIGSGTEQIINVFLIVIAEYIYCFGNYIYMDYSFYAENKFMEQDDEKIIFYYNKRLERPR